ncbi:DegV family protein [Mobilitalea sibirica]|uniref:DegV family protein n=1 Tax=Mobilitalea sibirica TaxID=1462919 RepID=A0A8J7HBK3_9FIRM|nr:DegV family protein [Mobilitalea sibirica]MBH1940087.1 DegV family protein [Mobilitalea sibirica]
MSYRIIGDSCTDLPKELKENEHFRLVPLTLIVEEEQIRDDETFDQKMFLSKVKASPHSPKSACPSPEDYMKEFDYDGDIYVITLSSNLSGSYNSAQLAKNLYLEEHPDKNIEVIDSRSASVAQTLIAMKIKELIEGGTPFDKVVEKIHTFRDNIKTKFVLESLETLRKNGRLTGLQAIIASALNIKPVMGATPEGTIYKLDQARGIVKALITMAKQIEQDVLKPHERILGISHCNNYERALFVKEEILKRVPFKDCFIVDTAGVSSLYANEGGIITAY